MYFGSEHIFAFDTMLSEALDFEIFTKNRSAARGDGAGRGIDIFARTWFHLEDEGLGQVWCEFGEDWLRLRRDMIG